MRVLLSAFGACACVEPVVELAVRVRALGAAVRVCAPPDEAFAARLAGVGVPPVRPMVHGSRFRSAADVPRRAAELIVEQFDKVAGAAEGCDALVATGVTPAGVWL